MTDITQNNGNTTTNHQNQNTTKELFGGNQAVFENLEKFEQISNPTGDLDFDFAFEEALDQDEAQNTETQPTQEEFTSSAIDHTETDLSDTSSAGEAFSPEDTITFQELSNLKDNQRETVDSTEKENTQTTENIFEKIANNHHAQDQDTLKIENLQITDETIASQVDESEENLTQLASKEKVMKADFSFPSTTSEETNPNTPNQENIDLEKSWPKEEKNTLSPNQKDQDATIAQKEQQILTQKRASSVTRADKNSSESEGNIPQTQENIKHETHDPSEEQKANSDTNKNTNTISTDEQAHQQLENEPTQGESKYIQKYLNLLHTTEKILEIKGVLEKTEITNFDILGNDSPKNQTIYTFTPERAWPLTKLIITKTEKDLIQNTTLTHTLEFYSSEENHNLHISVDDFLLYQEIPDLEDAMKGMQVDDKLNKFIFLLGEKLSPLEKERETLQEAKEKQKAFRTVFRNF